MAGCLAGKIGPVYVKNVLIRVYAMAYACSAFPSGTDRAHHVLARRTCGMLLSVILLRFSSSAMFY